MAPCVVNDILVAQVSHHYYFGFIGTTLPVVGWARRTNLSGRLILSGAFFRKPGATFQ